MTKRILTVLSFLIAFLGLAGKPAADATMVKDFAPVTHTVKPVKRKPLKRQPTPRASRSYIRPVPRPTIVHLIHNWYRVAQCESGGDWSINSGNGFYGGLQFTLQTWYAFGGTGMPQYASPATQISVAERVLSSQGRGAWPICGVYL